MRNFKILAVAVCAVMLFAFSSCGNKENNAEPSQKPGDNTNAYVTDNPENAETAETADNPVLSENPENSGNPQNNQQNSQNGTSTGEKTASGNNDTPEQTTGGEKTGGMSVVNAVDEGSSDEKTSENNNNYGANTETGYGHLFMPESKIK